ncbi:MAG: hypothetical protein HDT28_01850 [Clostridiales bacterium]|nr:hypothetical protein [Clostridiales bacterium]
MKIDIFDYIEKAASTLDANLVGFTHAADRLTEYLLQKLGDVDATIGVTSRIKTRESLKEKILRNHLYLEAPADRIVFEMHDIIGVKVECRFFKDEEYLYDKIREIFCVDMGDGYFCPEGKKAVKLKLSVPQPEKQKNGYTIYRIDGRVLYAGETYNFELQIKSLVNSFWSEIEHKLIYKNNRLNQFDSLMKEMLDSTRESLSGIDHQLSLLFDRVSGNMIVNQQEQLRSLLTMGINEMFTAIVKANTGIPVGITDYSEAIVEYLICASSYTKETQTSKPFIVDLADNMSKAVAPDSEVMTKIRKIHSGNNYGGLFVSLMDWIRTMDYGNINIGEKVKVENTFEQGVYSEVAKIFIRNLNEDFYLNTFFHILFSLERGNDTEDFTDYIRYYTDAITAGKTQDKIYRTVGRLSELPAHKLPLTSTMQALKEI